MLEQHTLAAPRIVDRPPERVAVVETVGGPDEVGGRAVGALYGAIAQLGLRSGPLRARWPNATRRSKRRSIARWALPVPDHTPDLGGGIELETWYGHPVAEVVHVGTPADRARTVERLIGFIADCGYEIAGPPEEEYLTLPGEEPRRTIIRYEIRQAHRKD
jgi:effector-binding domain-containing protein